MAAGGPGARPAYALYTRRLRRDVRAAAGAPAPGRDPRRQPPLGAGEGLSEAGAGHRRGADKIEELLDWCAPLGDRGDHRLGALEREPRPPRAAADALFDVVCDKLDALEQRALRPETAMRVRVIGRSEELPERVSATIRRIEESTAASAGPEPHDRARLQRPGRADRRLQDARVLARGGRRAGGAASPRRSRASRSRPASTRRACPIPTSSSARAASSA